METKALLEEVGLRGWPKTSGSRGMHVNVRIEPRWTFTEVRRAALALSRAVERRVPQLASSKWWKEERHGVFLDYNQNAKDRTTCSAYSVRPLPDARVSTPLTWTEVMECDPAAFTLFTVPERLAQKGDPQAEIDHTAGSLETLLEMAARDEAEGLGDAPWPPHFRKMEGESPRVAPSRAKREKSFAQQMQEGFGEHRFRKRSKTLAENTAVPAAKKPRTRASKQPLIIVAQSPDKEAVEAGLERWKQAHPEAAGHLAIDDVLVDRMRGASSIWYRVRVNLRHVPEEIRPEQGTPDPDEDPTRTWREARDAGEGDKPRRSRKKE